MDSLSRKQVRSIDAYAIEQLGIPGVILMENAGSNAASAVVSFLGGVSGRRIAVAAGAGNNGGDGFVIARHLANMGAEVVTFLVVDEDKIRGDARINLDIIRSLDHDIRGWAGSLEGFELVIDAIGGTGISGALRGDLAEVVEYINGSGIPVVSVDIPTGLDCDTGRAVGPAVRANMTVTFVAKKTCFDNPSASKYTGDIIVVDIGIDPEAIISKIGFPEQD